MTTIKYTSWLITFSEAKDAHKLSRLGHFLKGSSAALGMKVLRQTCERIQKTGETSSPNQLEQLRQLIEQAKKDYIDAQMCLKQFYHIN